MTGTHDALLDDIEMALGRDENGMDVLTPDQVASYLKKMEAVMQGEVGHREWRLHEALKAKMRQ